MTEKTPSSTRLGSRPRWRFTCSYSSGVKPCRATVSGVISLMEVADSNGRGERERARRNEARGSAPSNSPPRHLRGLADGEHAHPAAVEAEPGALRLPPPPPP